MNSFVRASVSIVVFLTVTVFSNLIIQGIVPPSFQIIGSLFGYIAAFYVARFVWRKLQSTETNGLLANIITGACVIGAISFIAGFAGPIIFTPESNQGPLLGIFITGPIGFLAGGVIGALRWTYKSRRS